jgi:hypothetical protein
MHNLLLSSENSAQVSGFSGQEGTKTDSGNRFDFHPFG